MSREDEIAFCHKRIKEQGEYMAATIDRKDIGLERKSELILSANTVLFNFKKRLEELTRVKL